MTGTFKFTGAAPSLEAHWKAINWPKVENAVKRLQMRIAKAEREGKRGKVKALQWILPLLLRKIVSSETSVRKQRGKMPRRRWSHLAHPRKKDARRNIA